VSVLECTKDGKRAFKWSENGEAFTGADARERALAVGRALQAQKSTTTKSAAEIETLVRSMETNEVLQVNALFPDPAPAGPALRQPGIVKKSDDELRIIWSEVYIPDFPDAHGDFMNAEEIRKMAHKFIGQGLTDQCDLQHDNSTSHGMEIVESFIARKDDTVFIADSWVVGVRVNDDALWEQVKSGEFNGFSMQAKVFTKEVEIEVEIPEEVVGQTERPNEQPKTGHRHSFTVRFDENGKFVGGQTTTEEGHFHRITAATLTGPPIRNGVPEDSGHVHRYSFLDKIFGVPLDSEGRELLMMG